MEDYELKDSGKRQTFSGGSQRDTNENKGDYSLLATRAIRLLALHFQKGIKKYGRSNYRLGQPLSRYIDSGLRHLFKHLEGQVDERHDIAACWNILCMLETSEMIKEGKLDKSFDDLEEIQTGKPSYDLKQEFKDKLSIDTNTFKKEHREICADELNKAADQYNEKIQTDPNFVKDIIKLNYSYLEPRFYKDDAAPISNQDEQLEKVKFEKVDEEYIPEKITDKEILELTLPKSGLPFSINGKIVKNYSISCEHKYGIIYTKLNAEFEPDNNFQQPKLNEPILNDINLTSVKTLDDAFDHEKGFDELDIYRWRSTLKERPKHFYNGRDYIQFKSSLEIPDDLAENVVYDSVSYFCYLSQEYYWRYIK